MKNRITTLLCLLAPVFAFGQIPPGYYNATTGLSGQALRAALSGIVRPHTQITYSALWTAYRTTDVKPSGKLWDIYSDVPGGTPAYEYTIGTDQCGSATPTAEGTCYNREHTWPQSYFSSDTPMLTDLFHVMPTDNIVNGTRGDLPYGKVGSSISRTFTNGSKVGNNVYPGAPSGNCYEPLDSFKGDIARIYFYMSACYMMDSNRFASWEMAYNTSLKPWAIQMLLDWHHMDPVSTKEINRNNAVYAIQRNRNPFVDHPDYADCIWGVGPCTTALPDYETTTTGTFAWYNATTHEVTFAGSTNNGFEQYAIVNYTGAKVFETTTTTGSNLSTADASNFAPGLYIILKSTRDGVSTQKIMVY